MAKEDRAIDRRAKNGKEDREIDIAKIENCDIGFDDHGLFLMFTRFVYLKKGCATGSQGIGYVIDDEFIKRFIRVCGAISLFQCEGKKVKVEHTDDNITKIMSLSNKENIFDIDEWRKMIREKGD